MACYTWKDAAAALKDASKAVTSKQLAIAKTGGLAIPSDTPSIVAAAMLRVAFHTELGLPAAGPPREYVASTLEAIRAKGRPNVNPQNEDEAVAWLSYFRFRSRLKHLAELQIEAGDIVKLGGNEFAEVSSIDRDGGVFFKGGRGARAWPDLIVSVVARREDNSRSAAKARKIAENCTAIRTASAAWSSVKSEDLREFETVDRATEAQIDDLERVIMSASDERPIQLFLQEHCCLLTALLGGNQRFCVPQKRLGAEYVPDFIIGDVDSLGVRWVLVELETPNSGIYLANGQSLDKYARKGVDQITDWRNWLQHNIAYAHKPKRREGLGLSDISAQSEAIVLVGRRTKLPPTKDAKRRELRERLSTHVHTYDWLLERLRGAIAFNGPPASNPHLIARCKSDSDGDRRW